MRNKATKTYSVYIKAIAKECYHNDTSVVVEKIVSSKRFATLTPILDKKQIEKVINMWKLAIVHESKLIADLNNLRFIRVSNQWLPPIMYYGCYSISKALFMANQSYKESQGKGDHSLIISIFNNFIKDNSECLFYPLNLRVSGSQGVIHKGYYNETKRDKDKHIWSPKTSVQEVIKSFLLTTREKAIKKVKLQERESKKIKKLTKEQTKNIVNKAHDVSLLDCYYRLRIKSNYINSDDLTSFESDQEAIEFAKNLHVCMNSFLLNIEPLLIKYIGKEQYLKMVSELQAKSEAEMFLMKSGFFKRHDVYKNRIINKMK